jgi:predicted nucleotidyltransferase
MKNFIPPIEIHETLNPKLWDDNHQLHDEVRESLLRIAKEFYKFLEVKSKVSDIVITGSQANYNYSPYSDIDLHLIIAFDQIKCEEPIAELFDAKRKLWKEIHDIDIYDMPVEVYVEDQAAPAVSSSFSLIKNQWIQHPTQSKIHYNREQVERLTAVWTRIIHAAISTNNLDQCKRTMKLLSKFRKLGLKSTGEFGLQNLVFKSLRNSNTIEHLSQTIKYLEDQQLSLN